MPEIIQDDTNFTNRLDELVFECETCGWWCDRSEESSTDMVCDECDDNEEDQE
jgi:predicted RNA-binding Zn-ribbon protein involved in translation (DUF1610 family)